MSASVAVVEATQQSARRRHSRAVRRSENLGEGRGVSRSNVVDTICILGKIGLTD